jgi:rhamnosyltransferase subunit B
MRIVLTPVGSSGDVNPYVGLGKGLRDRGHDVVVFTSEPFRSVVEEAGLGFSSSWSSEKYYAITRDPELWHPTRGHKVIFRILSETLRSAYWDLVDLHEPGTAYVGHSLAMVTRLMEETHDSPFVSCHLAPIALRTLHQQPAYAPGKDLTGLPLWLKRAMFWVVDNALLDPHILPTLNRLRVELQLPPVKRVFKDWINSPQGVIGMFPSWFGEPQPDWPGRTTLTGFPLADGGDGSGLDSGLQEFLDKGDPPILFTPGSANRQASKFFDAALAATIRLKRRAIFATSFPEHLPGNLPESIYCQSYVPFSEILPRCAAIVHHGGIGTCAQGLAAGVPQLTMPMTFDQPDNVTRLANLGVSSWLLPKDFTGEKLARKLGALLADDVVASRCSY